MKSGGNDFVNYLKRTWKYLLLLILVGASFQLYFIFLMRSDNTDYLIYLDILLGMVVLFFLLLDFWFFHRKEQRKREFLQERSPVYQKLTRYENLDIAEHDARILEEQLNEKYLENCELQDYVARWCHEVKLPLSAALLTQEKIPDSEMRGELRMSLERIRNQMNSMLMGCRLQSTMPDIQLKKQELLSCVRESIHNQQFFLIQKKFEVKVEVADVAYTDKSWLVYVLDQLIGNAIKYGDKEQPVLHIFSRNKEGKVQLCVEDNGEGIRPEDIRHIYEKGFTGVNHHNGQYKSTGMGLYMVSRITGSLGHGMDVESEPGKGTRFTITFQDNPYDM